MMLTPALWRIEIRVPVVVAEHFAAAIETVADAVSWTVPDDGGPALVQGYAEAEPDRAVLTAGLKAAADAVGVKPPPADVMWLAPRDWLAENRRDLPPLTLGRFHLRGSHHDDAVPPGAILIRLDAATAFGSGRHATTAGCLSALQGMARTMKPRRALDMGCGSGILAIAMAKLWPAVRVIAADIDPEAVRVARGNALGNGVPRQMIAVVTDGYRAPMVRANGPYDIIAANILANPLKTMAGDLAALLAPGGRAVLSGLLEADAAAVTAAHRACGLRLLRRIVIDGWATLTMGRGA